MSRKAGPRCAPSPADRVLASGRSGPTAVLGCGVVGLSTAGLLQRHGFEVTIYARDLPPETTSNVAGASWYPGLVVRSERRTGILLGGTRERGVETLEPNPTATRCIFDGHRRIFDGIGDIR